MAAQASSSTRSCLLAIKRYQNCSLNLLFHHLVDCAAGLHENSLGVLIQSLMVLSTDVPRRSRAYEYAQKNVMWKDTLFPRQQPISSPSPRTAK